jgi:hypothetical protein
MSVEPACSLIVTCRNPGARLGPTLASALEQRRAAALGSSSCRANRCAHPQGVARGQSGSQDEFFYRRIDNEIAKKM